MTRYLIGLLFDKYFFILNLFSKCKCVYVLMYHRVNDNLPVGDLSMSVKTFREQMQYLKNYCEVINLERIQEIQNLSSGYRPKVIITIDDGYRDTYVSAFPVLKEFALPATVFLTTGFIGTDKKIQRYEQMPSPDMLNWQEIKSMQAHNISFGPHTVNHPYLSKLSYEQQKVEIQKSIDDLRLHLPNTPSNPIFCYPYGQYNQDTLHILQDLGIKAALTTYPGPNNIESKPLELKRISADGRHNLVEFIKTISPSLNKGIKWRVESFKYNFKNFFIKSRK